MTSDSRRETAPGLGTRAPRAWLFHFVPGAQCVLTRRSCVSVSLFLSPKGLGAAVLSDTDLVPEGRTCIFLLRNSAILSPQEMSKPNVLLIFFPTHFLPAASGHTLDLREPFVSCVWSGLRFPLLMRSPRSQHLADRKRLLPAERPQDEQLPT